MKFLVVFAVFFLLQAIAGQQIKDDHKPDHIKQGHEGVQSVHTQVNVSGHKVQVTTSNPQAHNAGQNSQVNQNVAHYNGQNIAQHNTQNIAQHNTQNVAQHSAQNVGQHVTQNVVQHVSNEVEKPSNQHSSSSDKLSVQIPPKVQQVVTHVSQHIPQVVSQHVANNQQHNKQRMVRSLMNRQAWQHPVNNNMEKPRKCAYDCSPTDLPVCAYNGRCYQEFKSQCEMSAYNCLNTQKRFQLAHDAECQNTSAVKCYPGDM